MAFTAGDALRNNPGLTKTQVGGWAQVAEKTKARLLSEGQGDQAATAAAIKAADAFVRQGKSGTEQVRVVESLAGIGAKVDPEQHVIRGVKLIGFDSKNHRHYPPSVLREAVRHYEGVKVNVDHPPATEPHKPRSVADRFGVIRSSRFVEGRGVFGDLHFNPKHRLAEQVLWDAQNNPESIGLSHNALLKMGPKSNGRRQVESVVGVRSVDLVADPATTQSLFEDEDPAMSETTITDAAGKVASKEQSDMALNTVTLEELESARPDLAEQLLAKHNQGEETAALKTEVEELRREKQQREVQDTIEQELTAAKLDPQDDAQVSDVFRKQLVACESADERKLLIDDRVALLGVTESVSGTGKPKYQKPRSTTSQGTEQVDLKPEEFASRLHRPLSFSA